MNEKRLYLSRDKMVSGVAGGVAEFFGIDPTIVRLLFVIGIAANGISILLYIAGMIVIPERPQDGGVYVGEQTDGMENIRKAARSFTDGNSPKTLGFLLIGIGLILLIRVFTPINWNIILPLALILGGGVLIFRGFGDRS